MMLKRTYEKRFTPQKHNDTWMKQNSEIEYSEDFDLAAAETH